MILLISGIGALTIFAFVFPSGLIVKITCAAVLLVILFLFLLQTESFRKRPGISRWMVFALVLVSIGFSGYGSYSTRFGDYSKEFMKTGTFISKTGGGALNLLRYNWMTHLRVDTYGDKAMNTSLLGSSRVSGIFQTDGRQRNIVSQGLEVSTEDRVAL
jgi:hypothetical protein